MMARLYTSMKTLVGGSESRAVLLVGARIRVLSTEESTILCTHKVGKPH